MTYAQANCTTNGTPSSPAVFSGTAIVALYGWCLIVADSANTAPIKIGPNSSANYDQVQPGQTYTIPGIMNRQVVDFSLWYCQSTAASQAFRILYVNSLT